MTKTKRSRGGVPPESCLFLPTHPALSSPGLEVVDTHTHVYSTYASYVSKYPPPTHQFQTVKAFAKDVLAAQGVTALVDVWCEAPMTHQWSEVVDSLAELRTEAGGLAYSFVVGVHPHNAAQYDLATEARVTAAHQHKRCVGWGEIGLDYHYDQSPREVQQKVLRAQLRSSLASGLNKAITIHTREADDDIWKILTEELPREQKLHIHCYTDTPALATKLLLHFPNLFIGVTGVITYSSNLNTAQVVRDLALTTPPPSAPSDFLANPLRIVLETDAPYMVPSVLPPPSELGMKSGQKMPFSHSGMLPWTAEFVAKILNEGRDPAGPLWSTESVLRVARENARVLYGI